MYYIKELCTVGATEQWVTLGVGVTLPHAMVSAANGIANATDGLVDHVHPTQCVALYMQQLPQCNKLLIEYVAPERNDPVAAYKLP